VAGEVDTDAFDDDAQVADVWGADSGVPLSADGNAARDNASANDKARMNAAIAAPVAARALSDDPWAAFTVAGAANTDYAPATAGSDAATAAETETWTDPWVAFMGSAAVPESTVTELTVTKPTSPESAVSEPILTEPAVSQAAATEPPTCEDFAAAAEPNVAVSAVNADTQRSVVEDSATVADAPLQQGPAPHFAWTVAPVVVPVTAARVAAPAAPESAYGGGGGYDMWGFDDMQCWITPDTTQKNHIANTDTGAAAAVPATEPGAGATNSDAGVKAVEVACADTERAAEAAGAAEAKATEVEAEAARVRVGAAAAAEAAATEAEAVAAAEAEDEAARVQTAAIAAAAAAA